jgi:hypothetical protein
VLSRPSFRDSNATTGWSSSQEQLQGYARRAGENIHELADKVTEVVDQVPDFIKDKQVVLTEAGEAGRTGHA